MEYDSQRHSPYTLSEVWLRSNCKVDARRFAVWEDFFGHQIPLCDKITDRKFFIFVQ